MWKKKLYWIKLPVTDISECLSKTNIIAGLTFLPSARSGFCVVLEDIYIFCPIHHSEVEFRATTKILNNNWKPVMLKLQQYLNKILSYIQER